MDNRPYRNYNYSYNHNGYNHYNNNYNSNYNNYNSYSGYNNYNPDRRGYQSGYPANRGPYRKPHSFLSLLSETTAHTWDVMVGVVRGVFKVAMTALYVVFMLTRIFRPLLRMMRFM